MEILNRLFETSAYAVLLFIIVFALKKILNQKMSPTFHFIIWFMLIARLCIPITIDSSLRLIVIPQETIGAFHAPAGVQPLPGPSFNWTDYFFIIWLGGILLLSIRMLTGIAGMDRRIKRYGIRPSSRTLKMLGQCRNDLGVSKDIKLFLLPNVATPALTISFKPKMILPTDIHDCLNDRQLELVIKHELMHYKRRDHLTVMLLRIIEIVYWFNPVVWLMDRYLSLDMESACDSMVVKGLDNQLKKNYALSLVQLSSHGRMLKFVLGLVPRNNERVVEKRIRGVFLKFRRKRGVIAAGVIAVVLFIGCFTTVFQPVIMYENASDSQIDDVTAVQEELQDFNDNCKITVYTQVVDGTGSILTPQVYTRVITTTGNVSPDGKVTVDCLAVDRYLSAKDTNMTISRRGSDVYMTIIKHVG